MKKQIFLLRTAPYDYLLSGKTLYQSFNAVAQRKVNPGLRTDADQYLKKNVARNIFHIQNIFCSPVRRSRETAALLGKETTVKNCLVEVGYAMENFITEDDFLLEGKPNVFKARRGFVNALITNKTNESYQHVIERVKQVIVLMKESDQKRIVIFTHGFFLKIVEAYIRDPLIENDPKRLLRYFDGSCETFHFCEGIIVDIANDIVIVKSYVRNTI